MHHSSPKASETSIPGNYGSTQDVPSLVAQEQINGNYAKTATETNNFWGMILVASFLCFWTISAAIISREQGSTLQWTVSRYVVMMIYCSMSWIVRKPNTNKHFYGDNKTEICTLVIHGILENIWVYTYFYALHTVYIGDIEAIFLFVAPTTIALIGRVAFNESFPSNILFIVIIDIVGVIFVTQPSFLFFRHHSISSEGLMLILLSTVTYSLDIVLIARNHHIHWLQMQISAAVQSLFVYSPVIFVVNMMYFEDNKLIGGALNFNREMLCLNAVVGVVNILSQICLIYGYQKGASTKVVWLEYVNLIFAYGIQWIIFREISNSYEMIGASLIASTFFVQFAQQYAAYKKEQKALSDAPKENTRLLSLSI